MESPHQRSCRREAEQISAREFLILGLSGIALLWCGCGCFSSTTMRLGRGWIEYDPEKSDVFVSEEGGMLLRLWPLKRYQLSNELEALGGYRWMYAEPRNAREILGHFAENEATEMWNNPGNGTPGDPVKVRLGVAQAVERPEQMHELRPGFLWALYPRSPEDIPRTGPHPPGKLAGNRWSVYPLAGPFNYRIDRDDMWFRIYLDPHWKNPRYHWHTDWGAYPVKTLLMPFAVVADIVTYPYQLVANYYVSRTMPH